MLPLFKPGGWQVMVRAKSGELIRYQGGAARVVSITPADPNASNLPGSPGHGGATLQTVTAAGTPPNDTHTAFLPDGGWLDFAEADPLQQKTAYVETWLPDAAHPFGAVLNWTYSYLVTGTAKPEHVERTTVHAGADLVIGTRKLHVVSLLAKSPEHPAYLQVDIHQAP